MSCLENIVSVRDYCNPSNNQPSLSGYDIFDAPELSVSEISAFIKEDKLKVQDFVKGVMKTQIIEVRNDFLGIISANGFSANIVEKKYQSTQFKDTILPSVDHERGVTLYKVSNNSKSLKGLRIDTIYINSNSTASNVLLKIYDGQEEVNYTLNVIAGINTFNVNYSVKSSSARITLAGNQISLKGGELTCMVGCNGTQPNPCAFTKSFNGSEVQGKESFGIGVDFSCFCDYEKLLCDLSKSYIGKLIYYKTRAALLDERIWSDRFNPVVVYKGEQAEKKRTELINEYNHTWNTLVKGLPEILKGYCGECIKCNGIRYAPNGV